MMKDVNFVESEPIRRVPTVVIAHGHAIVRKGLKVLVRDLWPHVEFMEVEEGDSLARVLIDDSIQLAIVDLDLPQMCSDERLAELARRHKTIRFVVISSASTPTAVRDVLSIPAVYAFIPKSATVAGIQLALQTAMEGKKAPAISSDCEPMRPLLTPRQEEIRRLLKHGMTNKMIAAALGISEGTVKNRISEIFKALNATNRTQVAQLDVEAK